MKVRIPLNILYQILFILCIIVPYFDRYELTFAVWITVAAITINRHYSVSIIKQLACFTGILLIACVVTFYYQHRLFYIIRDITYLLKPIMGLLIGYQLSRKMNGRVFMLIIITGVIVAFLHYIKLTYAVVVLNASNMILLRQHAGYFSDFEVYALILLIFNRKFGLSIPGKLVLWLGIFIGFSIFMYLARTNFIQFIVLWMAVKGYFKITRRSIIVVSSVATAVVLAYSAILYVNPKRNGKGLEALLYKIKIAPTEPFKTRLSRDNWKEFNDNYRSYENIMTLRQVPAEGTDALLFGKGLGSTIDLKIKIWLGKEKMRYISILHNGFMTVFLKSGLAGVLLFIISIYLLFKKTLSQNYLVHSLNDLMIGSGVFMIMSAWVFMGFYFLADTKSILIGMFMFSREFFNRQNKE
jgi:hypothetical protein